MIKIAIAFLEKSLVIYQLLQTFWNNKINEIYNRIYWQRVKFEQNFMNYRLQNKFLLKIKVLLKSAFLLRKKSKTQHRLFLSFTTFSFCRKCKNVKTLSNSKFEKIGIVVLTNNSSPQLWFIQKIKVSTEIWPPTKNNQNSFKCWCYTSLNRQHHGKNHFWVITDFQNSHIYE